MKGRSHRPPISEPPEDWGDGSWTVDCICGVNFDDGEEMVNCDECGVWVHTRCSRFVKGETSFACDKCKNKKSRNDSEETEVAQLLVELPTKTMKMDNPLPLFAPPRPTFRLWTDIPIEERVHVQGVPGGDPSLFQALPSVFTPALWKCAGYVPKKFNFQYREFPCWDEKKKMDAKVKEESENPVDTGAGVLFSLSKEIVSVTPTEAFGSLRVSTEGDDSEKKPSLKETKKLQGKDSGNECLQNIVKRETKQLQQLVVDRGKQKKEDFEGLKDQIGRKRTRTTDKEGYEKKKGFHGDQSFMAVKTDFQYSEKEDRRDTVFMKTSCDNHLETKENHEKPKNIVAEKPHSSEGFSIVKEERIDNQVLTSTGSSSKGAADETLLLESNDVGSIPAKGKNINTAVDGLDHLSYGKHDNGLNGGFSNVLVDTEKSKSPAGDVSNSSLEVRDGQMLQGLNGNVALKTLQPDIKANAETDDHSGMDSGFSPSLADVRFVETKNLAQHPGRSDASSENLQVPHTMLRRFPFCSIKAQDDEFEAVSNQHMHISAEISSEPYQRQQELDGSIGPLLVPEGSLETKSEIKNAEDLAKLGRTSPNSQSFPSQCKVAGTVIKSSSTSSAVMISKESVSLTCKPPGLPASMNIQRPTHSTKQRAKVNCNADIKKNLAANDIARNEVKHEAQRKAVKENPRASTRSLLKASQTSRNSRAFVSKSSLSDLKDHVPFSSSKASVTQNAAVYSGSVVSASSLQPQCSSHTQSKSSTSGLSQKGEKFNQLSSQPSSRVNHSLPMHSTAPVSSSTALSDEELALLLHQELNSSPRVPRVPRMRQTGSVPHLASPTATSMLTKRASSFGAKDQNLASRRKNKEDASRDGSHNPHEFVDESKKINSVHSSPDQRRKDPVVSTNGSIKGEADSGSMEVVHSARKDIPLALPSTANGVPSSSAEANDQSFLPSHNSPRNVMDDDADTVASPTPHTLPGLIDEIMSKGRSMTYEELCNAVLPHWHNLRKHNGERYAYSSHSQAVLDCLRNRNEWAQLVDRGPKTGASRKRRKLDAEPSMAEYEENECGKNSNSKEMIVKSVESHREDFPKGKRKARKRRRLALKGRGIKDVRKRHRAGVHSDDDQGLFSHSSEGTDSIFSEDESQGGRTCRGGSEASISSEETQAVS